MSTRGSGERARASDDRAGDERPSIRKWSPASQLVVPDHPELAYAWVVEYVNGSPMPLAAQKRYNEGWDFATRETLPEDFILYDSQDNTGRVRYGGFVLMQIHKTQKARRDKYYAEKRAKQLDGANTLQGVAGRDAVEENRGSRTYEGEEAARVLAGFNAG